MRRLCFWGLAFAALCATAGLSSSGAVLAGESELPAPLKTWADPAYTQRLVLEVQPPGIADSERSPREPATASVLVPLKCLPGTRKLEPVLLVGEDGTDQAALLQQRGSETEIIFNTRQGLRRFCLYSGSVNAGGRQSPPLAVDAATPRVVMRGASAPPNFIYAAGQPLTLQRFLELESGNVQALGSRTPAAINDPECPFLKVNVGIFGHVTSVINPLRYVASYRALLRAPVAGTYRFSVDTLGAAHLLIDGKPVLAMDAPDESRPPFAVTGAVELTEGVHRLTLYYAEANPAAETNASKRLFSVRLHWQPPFAGDFLCVPAQAFPKHLPAAVVRCEGGNNSPQPFIHIESVAQVLCGAHRGEKQARQRVLLVARAVGGIPGTSLQAANAAAGPGEPLTVWAAAGEETKLSLRGANPGAALVTRAVTMPCLDKNDEDLLDLEGELAVKSAPDFIYPDETAHIHLEALLAAPPMLVFKERLEKNLLPPLPRPMGRFRATWRLEEQGAAPDTPVELDATPVEGERRKLRVSLETGKLLEQARRGKTRLTVQLAVGGVEVEEVCLRLLHAAAPWPGTVRAGADHLLFSPEVNQPGDCPGERAMIVVPKQDEADYRTFAPLKAFTRERTASGEGLFLGDPLVESVQPKPNGGELFGLASALAGLTPNMQWKGVCTPGPHRYLPVFRMLADLESFARTRPDGKLPPVVVVCLGAGDVARQTPLHTFQRAVDAVVNRLRLGGARRIVVAGVIPEPARERQCETYQERLSSLLRQHHVDGLDIFNNWTKDDAWERRFLLDGAGSAKLYGPVPNAAAREEIAKLLKDKL